MSDWIAVDGMNHLRIGKLADESVQIPGVLGSDLWGTKVGATLLLCSFCSGVVTEDSISTHVDLMHREALELVKKRIAATKESRS